MSLKHDLLHDVISRDMPNATQKTYRRGISDFCDWAKGQGLNSRKMDSMASESLRDTIQHYEQYLAEKYESPNTIHTRLAPICKAFGITMSEFFCEEDEPVVLTPDQKELLENWSALSPNQKRAVLLLLQNMPTQEDIDSL